MNFSFRSYLKRLRSIIFGILIIGIMPALLFGTNTQVEQNVWEYSIKNFKYPLFPDVFEKYQYSMTIFFGALLIGLTAALILTFFTTLLPRFLQRVVYGLLTFFESLPDLFIVVILQFGIIYIYRSSGVLIANVTNVYNNPIYLLPILTLSILPTIQLFKIALLLMKDEQHKPYVTVGRAIGLSRSYITIVHVFRNILTSLVQYYKTIFVFMLSNLFIVEYVFNLNGIMNILLNTKGVAFMVTALMIAIPFSLLFEIAESNTIKGNRQEGVEAA
ncbi:ABC transporter permease subunit [Fictibacillus phosphorivorans]|uniref:ABC transporter permease subunit n=1 Tax=Fictibacillus phosphorivorans TaxID=1221500 RepID=UPI002041075E|nr:ABC transporter permease subunit [Fictibacillus phosphorivorans]MCM3719513.1 ABC transporter permease subunit [Fictibacillus phosphorivorans]